jgi:hypothetical protein
MLIIRFKETVFREIALMMEVVSTPKTQVNLCQTKRRNVPEDSHLHASGSAKLTSHLQSSIFSSPRI